MNKLKFWKKGDRDNSQASDARSIGSSNSVGRRISVRSKQSLKPSEDRVNYTSDTFIFKEEAPVDGIDIIDYQDEESSIVSKCIDSEISPSKLDGFKGIESEYVSLA